MRATLEEWEAAADDMGLPRIPGAVRERWLELVAHHQEHHDRDQAEWDVYNARADEDY